MELTRLHRLTDEEADLVFGYRLLSPEAQQATTELMAGMCSSYTASSADNVVSIVRQPAD